MWRIYCRCHRDNEQPPSSGKLSGTGVPSSTPTCFSSGSDMSQYLAEQWQDSTSCLSCVEGIEHKSIEDFKDHYAHRSQITENKAVVRL